MYEQHKSYWMSQLLGWTVLHALLAFQSVQAILTGQESLERVLVLSPATWLITICASHGLYRWSMSTKVHLRSFRDYRLALVQLMVLISLLAAVAYWLLLLGVGSLLPPPPTRSIFISDVFESFLPFILNFTVVNVVLLSLWWACFLLLTRQSRLPADRAAVRLPEANVLDADSPVMITDGKLSRLITPTQIEYACSEGNYVKLAGTGLDMLIRSTLSHLEQRLAGARFFRVNRQTLVNLGKVKAIDEAASGNYLLILESGKEVEASRRQGKELKKRLSL